MAAATGVTLVKQMTYRGDPTEEWSNQYWFTGSVPADSTAWKALADALILQEKTCYLATSKVIRAYGYDSDADDAVAAWQWDYLALATTVPGTCSSGSGTYPAGDQAAWVRWRTSRLNSRGKAIYLRKYFHGAPTEEGGPSTNDLVEPGWVTNALAFGAKMHNGTFLDGRLITARGHTDTIVSHAVSQYITTRTLKRRGKRPGS